MVGKNENKIHSDHPHLVNQSSGKGTKGDAFAKVESVEVISRKGVATLLHPMTILFPESKVTAIMGPSGSGKTTLLNFLTGTITSNLKANGSVSMSGNIGFVPQDDRLHGFYTCREYMMHYCRLTGMEETFETRELAMDLLAGLGLETHVDTVVGDVFRKGLSGGQKRRLSVALEALSRPETLFLDEPTSGLDSESAFQLIKFLVEYAKVPGRRVILTIHQPNSFIWEMLENVVLLSEGKLMYQGPREDMESFFASTGNPCKPNYNPADFYVSMVNSEFQMHKMTVHDWEVSFQEWQKSVKPKETMEIIDISASTFDNIEVAISSPEASSRGNISQVALSLTKRNLLNLWKNPGTFGTRVFMYMMLSLCIGAMFWDLGSNKTDSGITARVSLIFYCVAFFVFMSIAVVPFSMMERGIVEKEVRNGYYHPAVYLISQAVASVFGTFMLSLLTSVITVSMTGLREPLWYFLNMFLALNCAESIAYLISFIVPHYIVGIAVVAGFYGLFMLFQGFMLVPSDFPGWLAWTNDVSFHTYTWRTFMYKEFGGDNVTFDSNSFPTGMDVLAFYEIDEVNPRNDMLVLVLYAAVINVISMILLHVKHVLHRGRQVHYGNSHKQLDGRNNPSNMNEFP